jgi:hypothetical protein
LFKFGSFVFFAEELIFLFYKWKSSNYYICKI